MKRACHICGEEHDENWMVPIQTSRVRWVCWRCYKSGQYQVLTSRAIHAWDDEQTKYKQKRGYK